MANLQVRIKDDAKKQAHIFAINEGISLAEAVEKLIYSGLKVEAEAKNNTEK